MHEEHRGTTCGEGKQWLPERSGGAGSAHAGLAFRSSTAVTKCSSTTFSELPRYVFTDTIGVIRTNGPAACFAGLFTVDGPGSPGVPWLISLRFDDCLS